MGTLGSCPCRQHGLQAGSHAFAPIFLTLLEKQIHPTPAGHGLEHREVFADMLEQLRVPAENCAGRCCFAPLHSVSEFRIW